MNHYPPKEFFKASPELKPSFTRYTRYKPDLPAFSEIPREIMFDSFKGDSQNNFLSFLKSRYGPEFTDQATRRFFIGYSDHWKGATVFWQVDEHGKIRTGKIMQYNPETGKRERKPYSKIFWIHTQLIRKGIICDFNLEQCLFGLHQLKLEPNDKPIAIVEAEKTAILCSINFPEAIWMATGGIHNLKNQMMVPLLGREIYLFPDFGAEEEWKIKVAALTNLFRQVYVIDDMKAKGQSGVDIGDFV